MAEPKRNRYPRTDIQRTLFFIERGGVCECDTCKGNLKLTGQAWQIDHIVARVFGGGDDWENLRLISVRCHKKKTARDVADRAKGDRAKARAVGAYRPKRRLPGSKDSPWKAKVGGGWVRRDGD